MLSAYAIVCQVGADTAGVWMKSQMFNSVTRCTLLFLAVATVALVMLGMAVSPLGSKLYDLRAAAMLLVHRPLAPYKVQHD